MGEFEELTLLAVRALGDHTYAVPVQQFVEEATGRNVSLGAVYAALARLEDKGFVRSEMGGAIARRGGKPRRLYDVTAPGLRMRDTRGASLVIRSGEAPEGLIPSVRNALHPIDPRVRLGIVPVSEGLQRQLAEPRMLATLASALAVLALVLAAVGLHGVTTFVVRQRSQELGLRVALGASGRDIMRLLLADSLRPVTFGLAGGMLAALLASRVLAGTLYGVGSADPIAFGGAMAVLLTAALAAVIIPARRAAAIDPAAVLRQL